MSLLAPLYFAGALAIGLPILFHLIRHTPRGDVQFSSLMFLQPTPPRLTRRSRLENWPLLLLRGLALALLAAAFARPFLRSVDSSAAQLPGRNVVLLIDTSASMQRGDLWTQAMARAAAVIDDLRPGDQLAIISFDRQSQVQLGFDRSRSLPADQLQSAARSVLQSLRPSWQATELGQALMAAAELAVGEESGTADTPTATEAPTPSVARRNTVQMILISDLQRGSQIDDLQGYDWPQQVQLDVQRLVSNQPTNASLAVLPPVPDDTDVRDLVRVRVSNSADATESNFQLAWSGPGDAANQGPKLPLQVPPGQSRVVPMPPAPPGSNTIVVSGDDHPFDNVHHRVAAQPESLSMLFVGPTISDPRQSLLYYLQRVPLSNDRRSVTVDAIEPSAFSSAPDAATTPVIVIADAVDSAAWPALTKYVDAGGTLWIVLADPEQASAMSTMMAAIADTPVTATEAQVDDYAMLSQIDFGHPIFQAMADPQFNDFTKIRFWSHRALAGADGNAMEPPWQIVARFDDGDPALLQRSIGDGNLIVLAAGWQPAASQLALSTKFIPLVDRIFETGRPLDAAVSYLIGEPIAWPPAAGATIRTAAGQERQYENTQDLPTIIDRPGVYQYRSDDRSRSFAVNLTQAESQTEPLETDDLERFGITLGGQISTEQQLQQGRQLRDRELESSQKLWQWLLVIALGLLALEIWLAARWSRPAGEPTAADQTPMATT